MLSSAIKCCGAANSSARQAATRPLRTTFPCCMGNIWRQTASVVARGTTRNPLSFARFPEVREVRLEFSDISTEHEVAANIATLCNMIVPAINKFCPTLRSLSISFGSGILIFLLLVERRQSADGTSSIQHILVIFPSNSGIYKNSTTSYFGALRCESGTVHFFTTPCSSPTHDPYIPNVFRPHSMKL
jgi:hypothetical protein